MFPVELFQWSLIFVSKAGAFPSGATFSACFNVYHSGLTRKYNTSQKNNRETNTVAYFTPDKLLHVSLLFQNKD